jgi:hypothetical protein
LVIILTLLTAVSCDRFKHTFAPAGDTNLQAEVFTPLADSFAVFTSTNLAPVMDFYAEDYLHNGQYKSNREEWYQTTLQQNAGSVFEIALYETELVNDTLATANWRLTVTDNTKMVICDSLFTGEELVKREGKWYLYGNRDDCGCNPPVTQRVLLEYFTFQTCPNCPVVEELLHSLYLSFANEMTYLEYHLNDPMALAANLNLFQYYGLTNMPVTIFQGETVIYGNNEDNEVVFTQLVQNLANQPAKIGLTDLQHTFTGNALNGSVKVEIKDAGVSQDNLKLKYVIMERVSDQYVNAEQVPCKNVVLTSGITSLAGADLQQNINFNLTFNGILPSDAYLVIWAQEVPAGFANNASVYHALESLVIPAKNRK